MRRQSEILLLLPLLPIFVLGAFPMLLFAFLGYAGFFIVGVLMICVGLGSGLTANSDFNREAIVHGYARRPDRAVHASNLHSAIRFARVTIATGVGLIAAAAFGFYFS
jgi:hypothetical protein